MRTMLILRGNSGTYADEDGKPHKYEKGALHEGAATTYAARKGYRAKVLDISGDSKPPGPDAKPGKDGKKHGTRDDSPQTLEALSTFRSDTSIRALYGFSGGGYNVWWILKKLTPTERDRLKLVTVVGVDTDRPRSNYESSQFSGGSWELIYRPNHPNNHMFEPAALLAETPAGRFRDRSPAEEDDD